MEYSMTGEHKVAWCPRKHPHTPDHRAGIICNENGTVFFETSSDFAHLTASDLREIADEMEKK